MFIERRPLIVGLGGTTRPGSSSESATRAVLAAASALGAETELFDGRALALPMYAPEVPFRTAEALTLLEALRRADGIVLASPGYHGSISGLLKNALDYTEDMRDDSRSYFEGRAVACIVCAAGWQAVGTTLTAMRSIVHALRGWPTPLGIGVNTIASRMFDADGLCIEPATVSQFQMMADQLVTFARRAMADRAPALVTPA